MIFAPQAFQNKVKTKNFVNEVRNQLKNMNDDELTDINLILYVCNLSEWSFERKQGAVKKQCVMQALQGYYDDKLLDQLIELFCNQKLLHKKTIVRRLKYFFLACFIQPPCIEAGETTRYNSASGGHHLGNEPDNESL